MSAAALARTRDTGFADLLAVSGEATLEAGLTGVGALAVAGVGRLPLLEHLAEIAIAVSEKPGR